MLNKEQLEKIWSEYHANEKAMREYIIERIEKSKGKKIDFDDSCEISERDWESWYKAKGLFEEDGHYYVKTEVEHHYSSAIEKEDPILLDFLDFADLLVISLYLADSE